MKHSVVLLSAITIFLYSPSAALAQGEGAVLGVVVANADGSPIPDATIALQGAALPAPIEARTGLDGHFSFQRLVPGDYLLTVRHGSFLEERYKLTLKPREI